MSGNYKITITITDENGKSNSVEIVESDKIYWSAVEKLLETSFKNGNRAGVGTVSTIGEKK